MLIVARTTTPLSVANEDYSEVFVVIIESKVRLESLLNASLLLATTSLARFLPLSEVPARFDFFCTSYTHHTTSL